MSSTGLASRWSMHYPILWPYKYKNILPPLLHPPPAILLRQRRGWKLCGVPTKRMLNWYNCVAWNENVPPSLPKIPMSSCIVPPVTFPSRSFTNWIVTMGIARFSPWIGWSIPIVRRTIASIIIVILIIVTQQPPQPQRSCQQSHNSQPKCPPLMRYLIHSWDGRNNNRDGVPDCSSRPVSWRDVIIPPGDRFRAWASSTRSNMSKWRDCHPGTSNWIPCLIGY